MKLKEKLAFEYAETEYNMYGPNGEGVIAEKAYLAGFEMGRQLSALRGRIAQLEGDHVYLEVIKRGEEEV